MDCKFVKNLDLLAFAFNQDRSSIFYLVETQTTLKIIEENLHTNIIINQFKIPLKHKKLEADNYLMAYNKKLKTLVLTLAYHVLIFSTTQPALLFTGECTGRNPYIITSIAMLDNASIMFFAALDQRNIYCINLEDCISSGFIPNFNKLKLPQDINIIDMKAYDNKLVAACNDKVIRCWNVHSLTNLKGIRIEPSAGDITSIAFSRDGSKFLAATSKGELFAWNGKTLGSENQFILTQKISDRKIVYLTWFHYCGEVQSKRFIVITSDGNVRLFSFTLEKTELDKRQVYLGKAYELNVISQIKSEISPYTVVSTHPYSNHVCFIPGRILYLVDYTPSLYYPIASNQLVRSFSELIPNSKNELFWQRELFFIEGMEIKRLKEGVEKKLSLTSVLEHEGLKVLRLQSRPLSIKPSKTLKFLIEYYLGSVKRVLLIYNYPIDSTSDVIDHYKEFSCAMGLFLGALSLSDPLIFLLNEDRQSVSVMLNYEKHHKDEIIAELSPEEKFLYQQSPGEVVQLNLNVKIQKVYWTPFRLGYTVLYRTENLLRFSRNYLKEGPLTDFDILHQPQYRINYDDIIIDIIWNNCADPIGAIVCLDKVVFVSSSLREISVTSIEGYITQAFWQGYTLFITTKVQFVYLTVNGIVGRLYSLDSQEDKYAVCMLMVDRLISAAKPSLKKKERQPIDFKTRYFNLMEPLVAGYLTYCNLINQKVDTACLRRVMETYQPYNKVSKEFIRLLNSHQLTMYSNYFFDLQPKSYQKELKAETICNEVGLNTLTKALFEEEFKIEEFWRKSIFYKYQKGILLDLYMATVASLGIETSVSPEKYITKIKSQLAITTEKVKDLITKCSSVISNRPQLSLTTAFGQKSLVQKYKDEVAGKEVDMVIEDMEISSVGHWIGLFSNFIEAKVSNKQEEEVKDEFEEPEGEFNDLLVYYRFDEGKGDTVGDLSDYGNEAKITNYESDKVWIPLQNEVPLEVEDKWGKKCPPQFSINVSMTFTVEKTKIVKLKPFSNFTVEIWIKPKSDGTLIDIGDVLVVSLVKGQLHMRVNSSDIKFHNKSQLKSEPGIVADVWTHVAIVYMKDTRLLQCIINCTDTFESTMKEDTVLPTTLPLRLGSTDYEGELTEFRLWRVSLSIDEIRDSFKTPLSIVADKRKRFNMRIREKKSSNEQQINLQEPPSDPTLDNPGNFGKGQGINIEDWGMPF